MMLEASVDDQVCEAAFWLTCIYSPDYPTEHFGELSTDVSRRLRSLAISLLVVEAKINAFYHNLIRSGNVRERYLSRAMSLNLPVDYDRCSARSSPLLDAVAANDFELARRITRLSLTQRFESFEYEDDYCYAQILQALLLGDLSRCKELISRLEKYLLDEESARLELTKSLVSPNQLQFDRAFEVLLMEREREIAASIARGQFEDLHVVTSRRIFVEGLAILRLAEVRGLRTEDEYLFCPSIARLPMTEPFPGEIVV